ncbi:MAG: 8-amino-7-oxononanoate synthase [Lysobacterales bacterium]
MRPSLQQRVEARLDAHDRAGLVRVLRANSGRAGGSVDRAGCSLRNFASNDYLGLAQHPRVRDALIEGARRYGVGSGGAHLLGGHFEPHHALERAFAQWLGYPAALLLGSGYQANIAVPAALLARGDCLVGDRLNHASLIDSATLAGARLLRYPHADTAGAARQLARVPADVAAMLATDGVFSMDGDVAPLTPLARLARAVRATLWVDDAHGCGTLGPEGRGSVAAAGLTRADVPLLTVTLGKAFGTHGALVLGETALIEALLQFARPYIYSTASPPALACASLAALEIVRGDEGAVLRARLDQLIRRWREGAAQSGLPMLDSTTAIQPLVVGSAAAALESQAFLEQRGFFVGAVRPPTVPQGQSRLRITLTALHTDDEIDALLEACAAWCARM